MAWLWKKRKRFEAPTLIGRRGQARPYCDNRLSYGAVFSRAKFGKYDTTHYGIRILKRIALAGTLVAMLGWLAWESLPAIGMFD